MINLPTLTLMTGIGNLLFAVLLFLYVVPGQQVSRAFNYWRWAKVASAVAFILTVLRPWLPLPVSLHTAHAAHFIGWTLELFAYCLFFKHFRWLKCIPWISSSLVALHLLLLSIPDSRTPSLVSFSLLAASLEFCLAMVLLRNSSRARFLTGMLGLISVIAGLIFLSRAFFGLWFGGFTENQLELFNTVLFSMGYLHLIGNSFGFLLLTKQEDELHLQYAMNNIAQAESDQRQLLSMASHEFRTPAAMIKTSLDSLALLPTGIPPEVSKRLNNIHLATQRMITLANHLISQDRFQELALAPAMERCELGQLVSDIVGSYNLDASLVFEPPPELLMIDADPVLLSIALNNLLDNAVRYSKTADGQYLPVEIHLQVHAHSVELRVCDHGRGIPDSDKESVFRRFYTLRGSPHGGIGLSIVHTVAAVHRGSIRVKDTPNGGATMCLTLPYSPL